VVRLRRMLMADPHAWNLNCGEGSKAIRGTCLGGGWGPFMDGGGVRSREKSAGEGVASAEDRSKRTTFVGLDAERLMREASLSTELDSKESRHAREDRDDELLSERSS
jgi:hypothetical protein